MNINIDYLLSTVQNHFNEVQSYMSIVKNKGKWFSLSKIEQQYYYRNYHNSSVAISDLCAILNVDIDRLYKISRLTRKWEESRNWEKCFPASHNAGKIIRYLTEKDKSFDSDINYIHYKINKSVKNVA